jgi:hypothetical protein
MHNRYANSKDMYTAVKNLGEDTIAAVELVLMVVSAIGLAIVIAKSVQKILKFAYHFMQKLGKSPPPSSFSTFDEDETDPAYTDASIGIRCYPCRVALSPLILCSCRWLLKFVA